MQSQIEHLPRYRQIRWWFHARIAEFRTGWRRIICSHACLPAWSKIRWSTSCIKTNSCAVPTTWPTQNDPYFSVTFWKPSVFARNRSTVAHFSTRRKNPTLSSWFVGWVHPEVGQTTGDHPVSKHAAGGGFATSGAPELHGGTHLGPWRLGLLASLGTYDKMWQVKHQERQISQIKSQTLEWRLEISSSFTADWLLQYHWYFYFSKWPWPGFDRARTRGRRCISRRHVSFHI